MQSDPKYADLCLLSLNADVKFEQRKNQWQQTHGLATPGQVAYIRQLIDDCRMTDKEHRSFYALTVNLSYDRAVELIDQLNERLNPQPIRLREPRTKYEFSMVLADQDYRIVEQKERRLFVLDSENRYCYIKGWQHPDMYSDKQRQKKEFPVEITRTLKGDPVWTGQAIIL